MKKYTKPATAKSEIEPMHMIAQTEKITVNSTYDDTVGGALSKDVVMWEEDDETGFGW